MSEHESDSDWIERIKAGDQDAAAKLWEKYYARLIRLACLRMRGAKRRVSDEEDVVARAFETFFRCAREDRFPDLHDRDDLWQLLVTITDRKAKNILRSEKRKKRGGGDVRGESGFYGNSKKKKRAAESPSPNGADQFAGGEPTPEFNATMADYFEHLLDLLDDDLREVALLKLEGLNDKEISRRIGRSTRTVNRRLGLIRELWKREQAMES